MITTRKFAILLPNMPPTKSKKTAKKTKQLFVNKIFWLCLVFTVLAGLAAIYLYWQSRVDIGQVTYYFSGEQPQTGAHPLFVNTRGDQMFLEVPVILGAVHPTKFNIKPDDCLKKLTINGQTVDSQITDYCDYTELGPVLDLKNYLRSGENIFQFEISDHGGLAGIKITPARTNWIQILLSVCLIALIVFLFLILVRYLCRLKNKRLNYEYLGIFLLGGVIRAIYFCATPYAVRGHDTDSHIDYIDYVARNFTIPPASAGWEYHQAPLYYYLTGSWMRLMELFGVSEAAIMIHFKVFSLLVSLFTLAVAIWIAKLLFPEKDKSSIRILFGAIVAVFPSLIFLSTRITNNGLYHLFAFAVCGSLILWWQTGKVKHWYILCLLVSLSILTKVAGFMFIPLIGLLWLARHRKKWLKKWRQPVYGAAIVIILAGWLPVLRFVIENDPQNSLSFGSQAMHYGLRVKTTAANMLTFNPFEIIANPFNSPWEDSYRRQYFWEYLFRSAFFGEFGFNESLRVVAQMILALGMSVLAVSVYGLIGGFIKLKKKEKSLHLVILSVSLLLTGFHLFYRFHAAFASNQDFRFSILLIIPLVYFAVTGLRLSKKIIQYLITNLFAIFGFLCGAFIIALYFYT